ncbi:Adaptive-response sensory-kinase SasA [Galdieria sulphuraria]|nr:Adaptive-response sensory-kinase SasA [Galdieria sulphuraria]
MLAFSAWTVYFDQVRHSLKKISNSCTRCKRKRYIYLKRQQFPSIRYYSLAEISEHSNKNGKQSWIEGLCSSEFCSLCEAQFRILEDSLGIDNFVLFFRKENELSGTLEFIPVCSFPGVSSVWVVEEDQGSLPFILRQPPPLPGGMEPSYLLPSYPFVSFREGIIYHLEEGYITIPIHYDRIVVGLLLIGKKGKHIWTREEELQILQSAKTVAIACTLNLRWQMSSTTTVQLSKIQKLFSNLLHQAQSPLMAIKTFAKLLLKRLPSEDINKELVQNILFQADRLQELLSPLQQYERKIVESYKESREAENLSSQKSISLHLCWLKDVIQPVLSSVRCFAREKGIRFSSKIERDMPPCLVDERMLREVVLNICENAIKFTPTGGVIRVECYWDSKNSCVSIDICDTEQVT